MVAEVHPATLPPETLLSQCQVRRTRRGGPGGQHRNKVETAVVLRHGASGIQAEANERRSQAENLNQALFRLRINLALAVRTTPAASPSLLWQSRCRNGRLAINPRHEDFPGLLAEALDTIAGAGGDVSAAAAQLGCTTSQFVKLLREEPRALAQVNTIRQTCGRGMLK